MRKFGVVGITLLGLWTAISAVSALFAAVSFGSSSDGLGVEYQLGFYVAPAAIMLIIGAALIIASERLAARWFVDEPVQTAIDSVSLLRIGIILVGLAISVMAIEAIMYSILRPVIVAVSDRAVFGDGFAEPVSIVSILPGALARSVQMLVGLLLAWLSRPIAELLWTHQRSTRTQKVDTQRSVCPNCGATYDPGDYTPGGAARCVECSQPLDIGGA